MYINYRNDRQELGFSCLKDINAIKQFKSTFKNPVTWIIKKGKQTIVLVFSKEVCVAVFIFLKSSSIEPNVDRTSFILPEVYQSCVIKSDNLRFLHSPPRILDFILKLKGGSEDEKLAKIRLVKSILAKTPQSDLDEISFNKLVKRLVNIIGPIISDQRVLRILAEFEKPHNFHKIQITRSSRPKGFETVTDDFENRLRAQKLLNEHESKFLKLNDKYKKRIRFFHSVNPHLLSVNPPHRSSSNLNLYKSDLPQKKRASVMKQKKIGSNVNSLGQSAWHSPLFGRIEKTIVFAAPSSQESNITPTPNLFAADSKTGKIANIDIAFKQFKERMTLIGSQHTDEKQEYFFEQLNQCDIGRFKALSTENDNLTIFHAREAETMLQSEFEGLHEPNSITRATKAEVEAGNKLDGRFRKGLLSGESNTLNEQNTDIDVKLLVSDTTLQYQADMRKNLEQKKPTKQSMYDQGRNMGLSIVEQKHKHCNPNKPELPSSFDNVKHIINAIELSPSETEIAKAGILDGARMAWAAKKNVPESLISDETALQGISFLNEDFTIERVN